MLRIEETSSVCSEEPRCCSQRVRPSHICSSVSLSLSCQMDPVQKAVINHTFGMPLIKTKRPVISCNVCQIRFNSEVQNVCTLPSGSFHFCTYTVHIIPLVEEYIPFSKFWTQRKLLSGAVFWVTTSLEFKFFWLQVQWSRTHYLYNLLLFSLGFVEFLCIGSAHQTVQLSNVPSPPSAAPPPSSLVR